MSHLEPAFVTPLTVGSPYYLGENLSAELPARLDDADCDRCFFVTSRPLYALAGRELQRTIREAGIPCRTLLIDDGETGKGWKQLERLCEKLVERGATKSTLLIAFGGGAVGNIVGMAASLLYRGIRFVEIPTTVMALTDSTLSNKQAINGRLGKNQFGQYHAPLFIWGDIRYVRTEPIRQQRAGVVEGLKNVLIAGASRESATPILTAWKERDIPALVRRLIDSKLPILTADPTEKGSAVTLEYGHTFGHAIEFLSRGRLFHGEAVSIGMCIAAELSFSLGYLSQAILQDHYALLGDQLEAPTQLPEWIQPDDLLKAMHHDNKRLGRQLGYLLLTDYGYFAGNSASFQVIVDDKTVLGVLHRLAARQLQPAAVGQIENNGASAADLATSHSPI